MDPTTIHQIKAETAALVNSVIEESGNSLAEVSRRTHIPYVSLHRKVNGESDFTINHLASISIAVNRPFTDLLPKRLTRSE